MPLTGYIRVVDWKFRRFTDTGQRVVLDVCRNAAALADDSTVVVVGRLDPADDLVVDVRLRGGFSSDAGVLWAEAIDEKAPAFHGIHRTPFTDATDCAGTPIACRVMVGNIASLGVCRIAVTWRWHVELNGRDDTIGETPLVFYVVLGPPTMAGPWMQPAAGVAAPQLPWTDVLDHACTWAAGARTAGEATGAIARSVFALGSSARTRAGLARVHYGNSPDFVCGQAQGVFRLTRLLEMLRLPGAAPSPAMSCIDCAAVLAVFANALGAEAAVQRLTTAKDLTTRTVQLIGGTVSQQTFVQHQVVSLAGSNDVFDPCIALDVDPPGGQPPDRFETPGPMPEAEYLRQLLLDGADVHVTALPMRSLDRPPWTGSPDDPFVRLVAGLYIAQMDDVTGTLTDTRVQLSSAPLAGLENEYLYQAPPAETPWPIARGRWRSEDGLLAAEVTVAVHASAGAAQRHAGYAMAQYETPFVRVRSRVPGTALFLNETAQDTVTVRGNAVAIVRSGGQRPLAALETLAALNARLV